MEIAAPFHVLLIEDSPDDRADIRQMLLRGSQRHYKFTEAETGSAALRALRGMAKPPDCILLDFNLPDMNALEILAEWHAGTRLPGCPTVVLTGVAECGPHVITAGAQDFVGKSWASPESLTRAVENAVERYALTREREKAYESLATSEQRLDLGLRVAGVGLAEVDYTTGVNHLSAESARQFGLGASAVAVTRERVHATFHPDDRAELATRIAESLDPAGAGWFAMDHRVVWPSGEVRWLRVRKQVTFAGEGRARRPAHAMLATFDITTEKRAEERLRFFEQVVTGIRDAVVVTEAEPIDEPGLRIVYVNPAFTAMTGYMAEEVIGRSPRLLRGPKSSRAALDKIRAALETWQSVTMEVTNYRKDGTEFEVELSIAPVANEHGCFTHWVSLQRDVSERNRVAEALAQNAALFAKIIEQAPGGVYVMDAQLRVREVNAEALPIFANIQPVIGREIGEVMETLWGPELGQECTALIRRTLETGERYISPRFDHYRRDIGVEQAYEWETQRITLPDGQHGVVCYFQDVTARERAAAALRTEVTERKQAEELQRTSSAYARSLIEASLDPLVTISAQGKITDVNEASVQATGVPREQLIGTDFSDYFTAPDNARAGYRQVFSEGYVKDYPLAIRHTSGRVMDVLYNAAVYRDDQGKVLGAFAAARDVTVQKQASQYARSLIEASLDPLVTISAQGKITDVNEASVQATGVPREQLIGTDFSDYFTAPDNARAGYRQVFSEGLVRDYPLAIRHTTGRIVDVLYNAVVYRDDKGNVLGVFAAARDVTERKRFEQSLEQTNEELRTKSNENVEIERKNAELEQARNALEEKAAELARASGYKSEFLANMSHELRTPLNSILIFSQQLAENKAGNLTAKQVEFSGHIHSSGKDLHDLINDILDLSKLESRTVSIDIEQIALARLRDTIDRNFRHVAEAKNLPFNVSFAPGLPKAMDTDPKRLQQILKNLLSNAMKFTALGKVEVNVDVATQGWTPDHPVLSKSPQVIAFAVTDTGIGIAPEKQRLIFEAFQQTDASTARKYGGTGLGLAISRELAALLGGEINLSSVHGQGSTFTLFVPLHHTSTDIVRTLPTKAPPAWKRKGTPHPHVPDETLRGRKVLIVDDDARNIFALTAVLEDYEMEVIAANNGRSAIDLIRQTPGLSLVLMDIMMPEMDGYETMREIRSAPEFRTLPILALTAKAMKGDREKCLDAGASDYIAKPVNTDQLLSLMRVWLFR
jgi:PAS domain S-box-containing protein